MERDVNMFLLSAKSTVFCLRTVFRCMQDLAHDSILIQWNQDLSGADGFVDFFSGTITFTKVTEAS